MNEFSHARKVVDQFKQLLSSQEIQCLEDEHFDELVLLIEAAIDAAVLDALEKNRRPDGTTGQGNPPSGGKGVLNLRPLARPRPKTAASRAIVRGSAATTGPQPWHRWCN